MPRLRKRLLPRIGLPWLLWLALLLPLAQTAAAWHELSHAAARVADPDSEQKALHSAACGLCLASAAVQAGGMAVAVLQVPSADQAPSLHTDARTAAEQGAPVLGYQSRAPPLRG